MKLLLLIPFLAIGFCQHLTIAPQPVAVHAKAFDNGVQNAGIVGHDSTGLIVTAGWIAKYDAMLKVYGKQLSVSNQVASGDRTGVVPRGVNFHVNFEVNDRFADLKYYERNSSP